MLNYLSYIINFARNGEPVSNILNYSVRKSQYVGIYAKLGATFTIKPVVFFIDAAIWLSDASVAMKYAIFPLTYPFDRGIEMEEGFD